MKKLNLLLIVLVQVSITSANNIQVSNVSTVPDNNTIKFTVTWENGWRSNALKNWDAAWVFLKYYDPSLLTWSHLNFTNTGNSVPAGFTVAMGATGSANVGAFLYRSVSGAGTTTITDIELGIPSAQAAGIYDIKVFAIEMVYVPASPFYLGGGTALSGAGRYSITGSLPDQPGYNGSGGLGMVYDPLIPASLFTLPAIFPNGYNNAFYCMKYELSQAAYRDFLNSLSYTFQAAHTAAAPNSAAGTAALSAGAGRSFIEIKTPGVSLATPAVYGCDASANNVWDEAADGEWVACNYISWLDIAAYLAWSGLRPISEMEYEKAARGIPAPVIDEFAWGNTAIKNTQYTLTNVSNTNEIVSNPAVSPTGNANYTSTTPAVPNIGSLRNGIFATATSDRISSGGGFYGVMELSGNQYERVVTTATTEGRGFRSDAHGDGSLNPSGYASVTSWPGGGGSGSVNATGLIIRGGTFNSPVDHLRIAYRTSANLITGLDNGRTAQAGCRGGRTAP